MVLKLKSLALVCADQHSQTGSVLSVLGTVTTVRKLKTVRRGGGSLTSPISARAPRASISLSSPDQLCPGPLAHMGLGTTFCLSLQALSELHRRRAGLQLSCGHVHAPSALPRHCGPLRQSLVLILTLSYTSTSQLDPGPASSPWCCLMAWTLAGPGHHLGVCPTCLAHPLALPWGAGLLLLLPGNFKTKPS